MTLKNIHYTKEARNKLYIVDDSIYVKFEKANLIYGNR